MSSRGHVDALPHERFVPTVTPLEHHPALAEALGITSDLRVKRDDLTGPGLGGNKVRKLEHLIADARAHGADTLVTVGSQQSNHCRLTAVLGAVAGLEVHLVLGGGDPQRPEGNLALDAIAGAELHHHATDDWAELSSRLRETVVRLREGGRRPYEVPLGGSTPIGALGYVRAWFELLDQLDERGVEADRVVHASSSGGTQAGLLAGRALSGRGPLPVGVDVAKGADELTETVLRLANGALAELGADVRVDPGEVVLVGGGEAPYGELTDATASATVAALRSGGLVVDPVYSGRALGALAGIERAGPGSVVFLHTGGQPALFAGDHAAGIVRRAG